MEEQFVEILPCSISESLRWDTVSRKSFEKSSQQIKVTKLMINSYNPYKIENRKLRRYMILYLEIMMIICSILAIKSETKDNLAKKKELWKYLRKSNLKLFLRLRWGFLGQGVNIPFKLGRKISVLCYKTH